MAQPSSSHHDRRERERSSHHHHRTVSSTTLLLTLSLILAVLAVMLSLPSQRAPPADGENAPGGLFGYLSPKRSQVLVARESSVAQREAEVARREAEMLIGAPGGVTPSPITCPVCPTVTETIEHYNPLPIQTVYQEIVKQDAVANPNWAGELERRIEDIIDRESKIADREKEISRREEHVNRREHDAARREAWIMSELGEEPETVEEEYFFAPNDPRRRLKDLPRLNAAVPTKTITRTHHLRTETAISTTTETVTLPAPAGTMNVKPPMPAGVSQTTPTSGPTRVVERLREPEEDEEDEPPRPKRRRRRTWFPSW